MSTFYHTITKIIIDNKILLHKLNIKPKQLLKLSEVELFTLATNIVHELEQSVTETKLQTSANFHHTAAKFLLHLQQHLAHYQIENNMVTNVKQKASRALVNAIQLFDLPKHKINTEVAAKLNNYGKIIATYGTSEQIDFFNAAMREYQSCNKGFLTDYLTKWTTNEVLESNM